MAENYFSDINNHFLLHTLSSFVSTLWFKLSTSSRFRGQMPHVLWGATKRNTMSSFLTFGHICSTQYLPMPERSHKSPKRCQRGCLALRPWTANLFSKIPDYVNVIEHHLELAKNKKICYLISWSWNILAFSFAFNRSLSEQTQRNLDHIGDGFQPDLYLSICTKLFWT